jgi:hypothetical protein
VKYEWGSALSLATAKLVVLGEVRITMKYLSSKGLLAALTLFFALSFLITLAHDATQVLRIAHAGFVTKELDDCREKAVHGDTYDCKVCLERVVAFYPSGTVQPSGTTVDNIVERERAGVAREVICRLRHLTGKDFGEDPSAWLKNL